MGDHMKKKNYIKLLSAVMSLVILCGLLSPAMAFTTSSNAHTSGLQMFFDEGSHSQLVDCSDAVYMDYAEILRTDSTASLMMNLLGVIYGGLSYNDKVEPDKEQYMLALVNILRTYESENAASMTQQNQMDNTKELKDYLFDVVDIEMGLFNVSGAWDKMKEEARIAISGITQTLEDIDDWSRGLAVLETTLQNYERFDLFLQLVQTNSDGALKEAATELRVGLSEMMRIRLGTYGELLTGSAEKGALVFKDAIFDTEWMAQLKAIDVANISKGYKWLVNIDILFLDTLPWVNLGVDIGKLLGNLAMGAEDVLSYIVEIKAVHDISIILENEMERVKNTIQSNSSQITETDIQNYMAYGNYLISCRIRGQYCMTAIYLQPSLRSLLSGDAAENAESLYNRLTNNLLNIKEKLDSINQLSIDPSSVVTDAVNYEKDVTTDPSLVGMWESQGLKHQIRIPKIAFDTAAAQNFNQKIYDNHKYGYELLITDQEENMIFGSNYEYKIYNNVVAIAVLDDYAVQAGGGNLRYQVYYYDLEEDKELTFNEYLSSFGMTYDAVVPKIMETDAYKDMAQYAWEPITDMTACLIDEKSTYAFFVDLESMDGWSKIETISVLSS